MVAAAVSKMKDGKACGPSGIVIEMVKAGGDVMINSLTDLVILVIKDEQIPIDWENSTIVNSFKGKGDAKCGNFVVRSY